MTRKKREDTRKRRRVNVEFSDEQYAQIVAKAGARSLSEFCRERILLSERFHDPLFEVSAKLSGLAAKTREVTAFIDRWDAPRLQAWIESGNTARFAAESEFQNVIFACTDFVCELSEQAREVSQVVAAHGREIRPVHAVKSGKPKS